MSIKLMTAAWSLDGLSIGEKLVFLCLADNANDDGKCWPSVQGMVARCGMSDRGIQKVISDLEKMKLLTREMRSGRSTIYHLTPELYSPRTQFTPEPSSPPPPNYDVPTPELCSPRTLREPSSEPSIPPIPPKSKFTLPDWIPADDWQAFMEIRKKAKAASTPYAMKLLVNQLTRLMEGGHDPTEIIQNSIRNSWKDFYEPKGKSNTHYTKPRSTTSKFLEGLSLAGSGIGRKQQHEPMEHPAGGQSFAEPERHAASRVESIATIFEAESGA